jgi:hypothetical protein
VAPRPAPLPRLIAWAGSQRPLFRALTALAGMATVLLTWRVWQPHAAPPELPLLPIPSLPLALPLLAALALCTLRPAAGLASYWIVLAYGIASDQTRWQPEFFSFGILLAAGLSGEAGTTLARLHLITLWGWAGVHKLFSPRFMDQIDFWMLKDVLPDVPAWLRAPLPWGIVAGEIAACVLAIIPRTRVLAALWAGVLHLGILLSLGGNVWNFAVWPWNILLAAAGLFLIAPWRSPLLGDLRALRLPLRAAAAAMVLYPLGFYVGLADTYSAHCLYALNEPSGFVCSLERPEQAQRPGLGYESTYRDLDGNYPCRAIQVHDELGVPFPPMHRLFEQYFRLTCDDSEFLVILERRHFYVWRDLGVQVFMCTDSPAMGS